MKASAEDIKNVITVLCGRHHDISFLDTQREILRFTLTKRKCFDHELNSTGEGKPTALFCVYWIRSISFPVALWHIVPTETARRLCAQEEENEIIKLVIAHVSVIFLFFAINWYIDNYLYVFSLIIEVSHIKDRFNFFFLKWPAMSLSYIRFMANAYAKIH